VAKRPRLCKVTAPHPRPLSRERERGEEAVAPGSRLIITTRRKP
jgi:hypothetical protein